MTRRSKIKDQRSKKSGRLLLLGLVVLVAVASCSAGNVFTLEVGDCFDDWEGATTNTESAEITDVPIVDCSQPHDNEIYMQEDLPEGAFPGDAAVEETAIGVCYDGFEDFVGTTYEDSDLDFGWLFPSSESWSDGDREVTCFVYDLEFAKLTGSMANAGIQTLASNR